MHRRLGHEGLHESHLMSASEKGSSIIDARLAETHEPT